MSIKYLDDAGLQVLAQQIYADMPKISTSITSGSLNTTAAGAKAVYDFVTTAINNIQKMTAVIVDALPETGETNKMYLVLKETSESGNIYDEYLYINGAYELIGSTAIDLSGYIKSSDLHALTTSEITAIITNAKG